MKKVLFPFLFFIFSFTLFAQDSIPLVPKQKKYSIGLVISPENTFRTLEDSDSYAYYNKGLSDSLDLVEFPKTAINFGIDFSVSISKHFILKTGLLFKDMGYSSKGFLYYDSAITRNLAVHIGTETEKAKFMFAELPIILDIGFKSKNEKWRFGIFSGILMSLNINKFFYKSRYYIAYSPSVTGIYKVPVFHEKFSTMRLGITSGFSLCYFPSERFMISLSPTYKYYFRTFYSADFASTYYPYAAPMTIFNLHEKPYSYGCSIGINYLFGKQ